MMKMPAAAKGIDAAKTSADRAGSAGSLWRTLCSRHFLWCGQTSPSECSSDRSIRTSSRTSQVDSTSQTARLCWTKIDRCEKQWNSRQNSLKVWTCDVAPLEKKPEDGTHGALEVCKCFPSSMIFQFPCVLISTGEFQRE